MNTKTLWIIIIALLVVGFGVYAFTANQAAAPEEEGVVQPNGPTSGSMPASDIDTATALITLTDEGFSPNTVTVSVGDTVRFLNQSSRGMWIGADEHPTHTEYDGTSTREHCADGQAINGTFDQCSQVPVGEMWEYTFTKAGTFGYHNHVGASSKGTVVVE